MIGSDFAGFLKSNQPVDAFVVRKGTRYKLIRDFVAYYHIGSQAPFSSGDYVLLPVGCVLTVEWESPAGAESIALKMDGH